MTMPPLGRQVAAAYTAKTKNEPNRLLAQSADSLFLLVEAIKWEGTRGVVTFSTEAGYKYHQWIDIPYITFQITAVKQPIADTRLVQDPGQPLDVSKLEKPAK